MTEKQIEFIVDLFALLGTGLIPYAHFESDSMRDWLNDNQAKIIEYTGVTPSSPIEAVRACLPMVGLRLLNNEGVHENDENSLYAIIGGVKL